MNSDCYFEIGNTHQICEDYALVGNFIKNHKLYHYAMISDGCTSSPDVDIGCRIICKCAEEALRLLYDENKNEEKLYELIRDFSIFSAFRIINGLSIDKKSLDATLIIAITDGEVIDVFVYGDGIIILDEAYYSIESPKNGCFESPFYISYHLDSNIIKKYSENNDYKGVYNIGFFSEEDDIETKNIEIEENVSFRFSTKDFSFVSVLSDGVKTYHKNLNRMDFIDMGKKFVDFKNTIGTFVKRRMKKIKYECEKSKIVHNDDISIATIYLK